MNDSGKWVESAIGRTKMIKTFEQWPKTWRKSGTASLDPHS